MANKPILILGGVITLIGGIILIINLAIHSSNKGLINEIEKSIKIIEDQKSWDNTPEGSLIFLSGEYVKNNRTKDPDFDTEFEENLIKRKVERYGQGNPSKRLLNSEIKYLLDKTEDLKGDKINQKNSKALRNLISKTRSWYLIDKYSKNISAKKMKMKKFEIEINTDYIINNGLDFKQIELTEKSIEKSKNFISDGEDVYYFKRNKMLRDGLLYYVTSETSKTKGDIRIYYEKFPTNDKITIIGEKKGKEIVPKKDLKGYENYQIFHAAGKDYLEKDFIDLIQNHYNSGSSYTIFLVISIFIMVIGGMLLFCAIYKFKD